MLAQRLPDGVIDAADAVFLPLTVLLSSTALLGRVVSNIEDETSGVVHPKFSRIRTGDILCDPLTLLVRPSYSCTTVGQQNSKFECRRHGVVIIVISFFGELEELLDWFGRAAGCECRVGEYAGASPRPQHWLPQERLVTSSKWPTA